MTRPIYAAIIIILAALFSWIYWETKAPPRPVVRKPVELAIRTWPGQDSQLRPRKWKRWRKPEVKDCLERKAPDCGMRILTLEEYRKYVKRQRLDN